MKHNTKKRDKQDKNQRKYNILKSIVEIFISSATPVGSNFLKEKTGIDLSPATLRNEMVKLEQEGFLVQSHISSGRIPTNKAYRFLVDTQSIPSYEEERVQEEFQSLAFSYFQKKREEQNMYDIVSILSQLTPNIAFATIPSSEKMFFLGASQLLTQTEFLSGAHDVSGIFKVIEEDLYDFLTSLSISKHQLKIPSALGNELSSQDVCEVYNIELFIGQENILKGIDSCSLLVSKGSHGEYFGILGPMRMDYTKNIIAMKEAQRLFTQM